MFNKKNDPLVESVKAVMKQNEVHRQAEAALNEELGISSKKALPHEYHAQYDALLEAKVVNAQAKLAGQRVRNIIGAAADKTVKKIKGALSNKSKKPTDPYKEMLKREIPEEMNVAVGNNPITKKDPNAPQAMEEKADYSPKQKKLARLGNAAGHGGNPEEIDEPDLSAARKGRAHKVGLEEKAVSKAQHRFFGLVRGIQKGQAHGSAKAEKAAKEMSTKEVRKFAKTKEKGLPERVDEAEGDVKPGVVKSDVVKPGDVNPSEMTPISKGLQGRIVKDPPKPKPETKQMNEVRILGPKGVGKQLAQMSGTTKDPKDASKTPLEFRRNLVRFVSQRSKQERDWRKADKSVAESVIDEIRENLEANLIAIHESGDDELFENYVNSLTEEELDILGLAEDWRSAAFGDNTSGGSLSNAGYRTPPSVAAAQARGAARTQQQARPTPSPASAARPVPSATPAARPATTVQPSTTAPAASKGMETTKISVPTAQYGKTGPVKTGIAPKLSMPTTAPEIPKPSAGQEKSPVPDVSLRVGSDVEKDKPEASPLKLPTTAPDITGTSSAVQSSSSKTIAPSQQRNIFRDTTPGIQTPGLQTKVKDEPSGMGFNESKQIKESLESFLRNRFLKG